MTKVESAILYDAVFMVYNTLETLNARNMSVAIDPVPLSCEGEEKYSAGPDIINLMREVMALPLQARGVKIVQGVRVKLCH